MKLKTKKIKSEFNDKVLAVLKNHGIEISDDKILPLTNDIQELFEKFQIVKPKTEHWQALVDHYFEFYKSLNSVEPLFPPSDAKALKEISSVLKRRFMAKHTEKCEWTQETAIQKQSELFQMVCELPYPRAHFSAAYIFNNFDKLVSELRQKYISMASAEDMVLQKMLNN